jgi:hypothetical protein
MSVNNIIFGRETIRLTDTLALVKEPNKNYIVCDNNNICELEEKKVVFAYGDNVVLVDRDKTIITNIRNCKILNVDDNLCGCKNGYCVIRHPYNGELWVYNKELEKIHKLDWWSQRADVCEGMVESEQFSSIMIKGDTGGVQLVINKNSNEVKEERIYR